MADYPEIERRREELQKCVTCGICHAVCPTYLLSGRELLSPRGRIVLLRRMLEGDISPDEIGDDAFDFCTLCYACQTACPAGIKTDMLFIAARKTLADSNGIQRTKRFVFNSLERPKIANRLVMLASFIQRTFGRRAVDTLTGGMNIPDLRPRPLLYELDEVVNPVGRRRARVGFLLGCVSNYVADGPAVAAIEVLRRLGAEVVVPRGQVCCGAPAFNNGDFDTARRLARINLGVFKEANVDAILSPDATCAGAFRHELPELLRDDPELGKPVEDAKEKSMDWSSFVLDVLDPHFPESNLPPIDITIHDPCHLAHTGNGSTAVRRLLQLLPGVNILEMEESDICCGFGGSFSAIYPRDSRSWTARKIEKILDSRARVMVAASPGCIVQIERGLAERDTKAQGYHEIKTLHPAELIVERCGWLQGKH